MNNAARIAEIVLPVVVSLFLGWLSRLKGILSRAQIDGLKAFVVTFSLPAVLFMAFAEIAYGLDVLLTCVVVFAACNGDAVHRQTVSARKPAAGLSGHGL